MPYTGGDAIHTLRRGFRAKGAGWLRPGGGTAAEMRQLAAAAGIPQRWREQAK